MSWTLLRVDKNGTKYWASNECPKCGGRGYLGCYAHIDRGICYECNGSGIGHQTRKEYTPEYAAKLQAKRLAKAQAKAPEINARFFERLGFSEDGKAWIVQGKTFEIKDDLKAAGARYHNIFGWHFDHEVPGYDCFVLSIEEIAEKDEDYHTWQLFEEWYLIKLMKELRSKHAPKTASEWVGAVGDKLRVDVTLQKVFTYETHFTYRGETAYIYKFTDDAGNTITWKTSKDLEIPDGWTGQIRGTVKEHSEYRGDKQTVLTRCKIIEKEASA